MHTASRSFTIPASYGDVSGVTAGADDVRAGKVIVSAAGQQTVGTMPDRGAVSAQLDGLTAARYVIPAGYHSGAGMVTLTDDIEAALALI